MDGGREHVVLEVAAEHGVPSDDVRARGRAEEVLRREDEAIAHEVRYSGVDGCLVALIGMASTEKKEVGEGW